MQYFSNVILDADLEKKFKTVFPMCESCKMAGKTPVVARAFYA
jgi:hypothetical protein